MRMQTKLLATAVILGGAVSGLAGSASALPASRSLAFESSTMPIENVQMRRNGGGFSGGGAMRSGGAMQAGPRMSAGGMAQGMQSAPRMGGGTVTGGVRTDGSFRSAQGTWQGGNWRGRRGFGPSVGFAFGGGYGYPYYDDDYAYSYAPDYYGDGYYSQGYAGGDDVAYCQQRYRSYDPASGTYLGYDGLRHPCP